MLKRKTPLRCRIFERVLIIEIGIDTLKNAAEHHDAFWQPTTDKCALVVNDPELFAKGVLTELRSESEDGNTMVSRMLDAAILEAAEQGTEGLDLEAMDAMQAAEMTANDAVTSGSGGN